MKSLINSPQTSDLHARHWLLDAVYGRGLLMLKLRRFDPGVVVPTWRDAPELDSLLDQMIDELNLRHWQRPVGIKARFDYLRKVLRMSAAVRR